MKLFMAFHNDKNGKESNMSDSGGGRSAGFAMLGLFALLPVLVRCKTK